LQPEKKRKKKKRRKKGRKKGRGRNRKQRKIRIARGLLERKRLQLSSLGRSLLAAKRATRSHRALLK